MNDRTAAMPMSEQEQMDLIIRQCQLSRVWFVENVLEVENIEDWQREALEALDEGETKISIRSGHGVGKTAFCSWVGLHYLLFRLNVKIPVTSPSSKQLKDGLYPEMALWAKRLPPFLRSELNFIEGRIERVQDGENNFISFRTARIDSPEALAGIHAQHVMVIVDEAAGVPEIVFENAQGTMSTEGAIIILIGNPTRTSGQFYKTHTSLSYDWWTKQVRCQDSSRVSQSYIDSIVATYGVDSNQYLVRVEGEFPKFEGDTVVPRDFVESAIDRDIEYDPNETEIVWGLDPGRGGDPTGFISRNDYELLEAEMWNEADTMRVVGRLAVKWQKTPKNRRPKKVFVDSIGMGGPIADRLRELDDFCEEVIDVNVAEVASVADNYNKLRDELWYAIREWFESRRVKISGNLRYLERLTHEITAPLDVPMTNGKLKVESKQDMKSRGLPSPNLADALGVTFAHGGAIQSGRGKTSQNWSKALNYTVPHVY